MLCGTPDTGSWRGGSSSPRSPKTCSWHRAEPTFPGDKQQLPAPPCSRLASPAPCGVQHPDLGSSPITTPPGLPRRCPCRISRSCPARRPRTHQCPHDILSYEAGPGRRQCRAGPAGAGRKRRDPAAGGGEGLFSEAPWTAPLAGGVGLLCFPAQAPGPLPAQRLPARRGLHAASLLFLAPLPFSEPGPSHWVSPVPAMYHPLHEEGSLPGRDRCRRVRGLPKALPPPSRHCPENLQE